MNHTISARRVVACVTIYLVVLGVLQVAAAERESPSPAKTDVTAEPSGKVGGTEQRAAKEPANKTQENVIQVYKMRYLDPKTANSTLEMIMMDEPDARLSIDATRRAVILVGPRRAHERLQATLEMLDKPQEDLESNLVKVFYLKQADPTSVAPLITRLVPKNVQVAIDQRTRSILVSGPAEACDFVEALLRKLDQQEGSEHARSSASYEVRIVWLASGIAGDAQTATADLKDVVAELSRLGIKEPRQVGQVFVRTSPEGEFQVKSSPSFDTQPTNFTASGRLAEQQAGILQMEISLSAVRETQSGRSVGLQELVNLRTKITVPPKQFVVLATAPVGTATSVFVVQVMEK